MGSAFLLPNAQSFSSGDRDSQPNLVAGMKWLLGVYTKRFNIRHKFCGHVFAGRYKALIVDGSGNGYLKTVCDYVHLNPVRAKLIRPGAALETFRWSSYGEYLKPAGNVRPGCGRTGCLASTGSRRTARRAGKNLPGKWSVVGPRKQGRLQIGSAGLVPGE